MSLSSVLQGIISQRLVRTKSGGRMAAVEILVKNARIESLILEGRDGEIADAIREGKESYKSQTFDQALLELYAKGYIDLQEALNNASSASDLKMKLDFYDAQIASDNGGEQSIDDSSDILRLKV